MEIEGCERDVRQDTLRFVVTLDFCREIDEHCGLLGYYAASLSTFRDNLSIPSKGTDTVSLNVGKVLPLLTV